MLTKKPFSPFFVNRDFWSKERKISFEQLWARPKNWVDIPNKKRGGWSAVSRDSLQTLHGRLNVIIKRQQNYLIRTIRHPFRGEPTFHKELKNIRLLERLDIPTVEPLFLATQSDKTVLVTKSLDRYISLAQLDPRALSQGYRQQLIQQLAALTRRLHASHHVHNAYYPKHVFVRQCSHGKWRIRIIDLEKLRWRINTRTAMKRDLSSFNRHADTRWTLKDRLYFLQQYFQTTKLSKTQRRYLKAFAKKYESLKQ